MNFTKSWDDKQKRIERLMEYTKSDYLNIYDEEKNDFDRRRNFLPVVSKVFHISIDKVKELIPWNSYIMQCDEDELCDKYSYFKDIFGDSLLKIINLDHIAMPPHYNGLFSYKDKQIVLDKVVGLEKLFDFGIEGVIRFLNYSSRYLYMTTERVEEYITTLQDYLSISYDETLNIFITYPNLIEVSNGLTLSRVERLCNYFSCSEDEIKNMYKIYPPALFYTPSDIDLVLRFNANRTADVKNKILLYPWIIDCVSKQDTNEYCGFSSLSQLLVVADYITNELGKVLLVKKKNWDKRNIGVTYLLIKSAQDIYYLLCLGAISSEDRLLQAIFGDKRHIISIQIVNKQNIYDIEQYILNSYFSFGNGLKGKYLKNGTCIIELKYENLLDIFPDIPSNCILNENIEIKYVYPLVLSEEYTAKHKAYYDSQILEYDKNDNLKSIFDDDFNLDDLFNDTDDEEFDYEENMRDEFEKFIKSIFETKEKFLNYVALKFNIKT